MLAGLSIRDFVLIEALDLAPQAGLTALTGETGAGKSILLDALGAACGARVEAGQVRTGAERASVAATFFLPPLHPVFALLAEQDIESDGQEVILRRTLGVDGRSKAFVNDQSVSVAFLKTVGHLILEVHGQFDTHGLLDPDTHQTALDRFAGVDLALIKQLWQVWQQAQKDQATAEAALQEALKEEDRLREAVTDLKKLAPQMEEEEALLAQKQKLQAYEKLAEAINIAIEAVGGEQGAELALTTASRALGRVVDQAGEKVAAVLAQLDRARDEVAEAFNAIEGLQEDIEGDGLNLEQVEDRLYALRVASRRYGVTVAELAPLAETMAAKLERISYGETGLKALEKATQEAHKAYAAAAAALTEKRRTAAQKLDKAIAAELSPLRMERAQFITQITPIDPRPDGADKVQFMVSTNVGQAAGALDKIASGGELARFMLALKVVLAGTSDAVTMIFDEVDQGVGGAVAAAVGERLAKLGSLAQVLVVTHSPQVAAKARQHWRVEKQVVDQQTRTHVRVLPPEERREELARMLSGEVITPASRAAAEDLLKN